MSACTRLTVCLTACDRRGWGVGGGGGGGFQHGGGRGEGVVRGVTLLV